MADIEKVIKGLERCLKHTCPAIYSKEYKECEYTVGLYCGQDKLLNEALELLKQQHGLMLALEQSNAVNEHLNKEVERLNKLLWEKGR